MGMIESGHKRMGKLIDLQNGMIEVVKRLEAGEKKLDILRNVKIGIRKEKLTLTDYDTITRMARREGKLKFRNRQKDPENNYELSVENHQRVRAVADKLGMTPRRALNKVLDDFFAITDKHHEIGGALGGKTKANRKG
jgi:hypothetical protein